MDASLVRAYEETVYWVFAPHAYIPLRIGERSPDLDALLSAAGVREWAFITACNPHSQLLSPAENDQRMEQLAYVLQCEGPSVFSQDGSDFGERPFVAPAHASVWKGRKDNSRGCEPPDLTPAQKSPERATEQHAARNTEPVRVLPGAGVGTGGDWPPEPSLLILGIREEDALHLARRFGQNAIVAGTLGEPARLVWC